MADIFLSYRRQDSQSATGRLADRLVGHFGAERVFRDLDSIAPGDDFPAALRRAIGLAGVLLVVVGPDWLAARAQGGRRRLDDPLDYVRLEIALAFDEGVAVVPVLVEGAGMPAPGQLPDAIAAFARCQAVELSERRWAFDVDQLIAMLQSRFAIDALEQPTAPPAPPGGFGPIGRFAIDLIELVTRPTKLIGRRLRGGEGDAVRAAAFMLTCMAIANGLLMLGFGGSPIPGKDGVWEALALAAVGVLIQALIVGGLAAVLVAAWRLVGLRPGARRLGAAFAYIAAGFSIGLALGALLLLMALQLGDAGAVERFFAAVYAPDAAGVVDLSAPQRWRQAEAALARAFEGRFVAQVLLLGFVVWLATAVWTVIAWGTLRDVFGVGRLRAAGATLVWIALLAGFAWLTAWLA